MLFNILKKEPKIEFWSVVDGLNDPSLSFLRPQKASKFFPAWFKNVQRNVNGENETGTIKKCPVFPEFLTQGYIVPLWCDVELYYDGNGNYEWKTSSSEFRWDIHTNDQYLDFLPEHEKDKWGMAWKAVCPWRMKTPKGYSVYQMPLWYHFQEQMVLPGSIRTDFHYEINQQMLAPKSWEGKRITLKRGDPFAWYIPYKRECLDHTFVPFDAKKKRETQASNLNIFTKFSDGYKTRIKIEDRKQ